MTVDISSRLAPKHNILRTAVRLLVGNMRFRALVLTEDDLDELDDLHVQSLSQSLSLGRRNSEKRRAALGDAPDELRLWGLTLGMTL